VGSIDIVCEDKLPGKTENWKKLLIFQYYVIKEKYVRNYKNKMFIYLHTRWMNKLMWNAIMHVLIRNSM